MLRSGNKTTKIGRTRCKLDLQSTFPLPACSVSAIIVEINSLKEHERINEKYCERLKNIIKKDGIIKKAITVDNNTRIVLDGHHRLNALKKLGCKMIPAILVDYNSSEIQVLSWNGKGIDKNMVITAGLTTKKFPPKTSKHIVIVNGKPRHITFIEKRVNVPLSDLK